MNMLIAAYTGWPPPPPPTLTCTGLLKDAGLSALHAPAPPFAKPAAKLAAAAAKSTEPAELVDMLKLGGTLELVPLVVLEAPDAAGLALLRCWCVYPPAPLNGRDGEDDPSDDE